jgi:hypothetical protein
VDKWPVPGGAHPTNPPSSRLPACSTHGDTNGDGQPDTWWLDEDQDGCNDLLVGLGALPGAHGGEATGINDCGQVIGHCYFGQDVPNDKAFIVVPEDTDGDGRPDLWYKDADGDSVNDLMVPLGILSGGKVSYCVPFDINNLGKLLAPSASLLAGRSC